MCCCVTARCATSLVTDDTELHFLWTDSSLQFFDDFDEVPSATFFVMVHALADGPVCGWDSTEDDTFSFEQNEVSVC